MINVSFFCFTMQMKCEWTFEKYIFDIFMFQNKRILRSKTNNTNIEMFFHCQYGTLGFSTLTIDRIFAFIFQ